MHKVDLDQTFEGQKFNFPDIDGYWDISNLELTESTIRSKLPTDLTPESIPDEKSLELLTQLARVQGLTGKLPEAEKTLQLVKKLVSSWSDKDLKRVEVRYFLELGRLHSLLRTPDHAAACFQKVWELALASHQDYFGIDAAFMLAVTQPQKAQSLWLERAIKLAESSKDPQSKFWVSRLYLKNGWAFFNSRKFSESIESFKRAQKEFQVEGDANREMSARWSVAKALRVSGQIEEAYQLLKELVEQNKDQEFKNGYVLLEFAECLQLKKEFDQAKSYFDQAYQVLSKDQWFLDSMPSELSRIKHIGKAK